MMKVLLFLCLVSFVTGSNIIEVSLYVDKFGEDVYKGFGLSQDQMETEIDYILTEINRVYNRELDIKIYKYGRVNFLTGNVDKTTDAIDLLTKFTDSYVRNQKNGGDLAILLTGRDIVYGLSFLRKGCQGVGWQGQICTTRSAAVVEIGHGNVINVMAHEIGHLLGAGHLEGMANKDFIMAPNAPLATAKLSPITKKAIRAKMDLVSCQKTESGSSLPNQALPETINTPDKICKRYSGTDVYSVPDFAFYDGESRCDDITIGGVWCINPTQKNTGRKISGSYNGMPCGKGKACLDAKCV